MADTDWAGSMTGGYDDEDEDEGTGTYVVMGVFDDDDTFDLTVAYGPFDTPEAASVYGTSNYSFSWVCEIVNVGPAETHTTVHPDQSVIDDYIDPHVVE